MMIDCKKCGAPECHELLHRTSLRSGFATTLCDECLRQWNEAFRASEVFAALSKMDAREDHYKYGAMGGAAVSLEQWDALYADGEDVNRRAFAFARKWMAGT